MTDMKDVDHTHPYNDRSAGKVFRRGPTVVADGGEAEAEPEAEQTPDEDAQPENEMRDVSHDDPNGEGANRVFERGREHDDGTGDVAEE